MKKIITTVGFSICALITNTVLAQDTIAAWIFPGTSANAIVDISLPINSTRFISCEKGSGFTVLPIDYIANGAEHPTVIDDKCATAFGFDNGADSAYWMIKLKTTGYQNIKVSSKQKSGNTPAGPKDFKLQYKLSGTSTWFDLTTVTLDNDWTTGIISEFVLPTSCENSSSNISLRWIMTTNTDIQGGTVVSTATSSIDDIVVTGDMMTGITSYENQTQINVYPNPNKGQFTIENTNTLNTVKIYNLLGNCVYEKNKIEGYSLKINGLATGVYFLQINSSENIVQTKKIIVE